MVECDLVLINALDAQIHELELHLVRTAKVHDAQAYARLQSIPGALVQHANHSRN
jgi:hypothetical protein